jgi:hypothetical protein
MKDPKNREMMTKIYRIVEKYEVVPRFKYTDDAVTYFIGLWKECKEVFEEYKGEFAKRFSIAIYLAISDEFKKVNPNPLEERPPEPDQLKMF